MEPLIAVLVGFLFATAMYCLLQQNLIKFVIGLSMITNAVNLMIFAAGRMTRGIPPLIPEGHERLTPPFANPIPEALILTAIVISFGLLAFTIALAYRAYSRLGSVDVSTPPYKGGE